MAKNFGYYLGTDKEGDLKTTHDLKKDLENILEKFPHETILKDSNGMEIYEIKEGGAVYTFVNSNRTINLIGDIADVHGKKVKKNISVNGSVALIGFDEKSSSFKKLFDGFLELTPKYSSERE